MEANANRNSVHSDLQRTVLFIDMNSYFASCEQQVNFYLRGRPVGVCVYTGKYGCIISPSVEAKQKGVKTGMRLNDAMQICPDLVPLETHPNRYREFHVKILAVLQKYSDEVIPKSIDEAVMDISAYRLVYKDPVQLARQIKQDIRTQVGDWLRCSIGIAPNAFLAKLGTELQKPDGLVVISPENIDGILGGLKLTDLPGIGKGMAERFTKAGIDTPLKLRHTPPDKLKIACKSIVGVYWHYRLNFSEVDQHTHAYKTMQAMRQISAEQRRSQETLTEIFSSLCMTLERRMVKQEVYCREIHIHTSYESGKQWKDSIHLENPTQDGMEILKMLRLRMQRFETREGSGKLINPLLTAMGITVCDFIHEDLINLSLFEDAISKKNLRKAVYNIKEKFGNNKLMKAAELSEKSVVKDVIGFGSVKDLHGFN